MKYIGRVIEINIPNQYKNGSLLDVMDRENISFKVETDKGLIEAIVKQNSENAEIMKNDIVEVMVQMISGKQYVDIRLYGGE